MKLHTLGTSSGTQPLPGHHHTCLALETESSLYFLDAGECGAYTAHLCGVDLLKTKAVFITHPHMDHVGGLGNLLWYIRKLTIVRKQSIAGRTIQIFTPCTETVDGFISVLKNTEGDFAIDYDHNTVLIEDGEVFRNDEITVTAMHTNHMPDKDGKHRSFAYRVDFEGKTLIFTGDMRLEDLERLVPDNCDYLLVETGHHTITKICTELKEKNKTVKNLFFVHHGGYIIRDMPSAKEEAKNAFEGNVIITTDGSSYEL